MSVCPFRWRTNKSRGDPRPSINTRPEKHLISLPGPVFVPLSRPLPASSSFDLCPLSLQCLRYHREKRERETEREGQELVILV